MGELLDHVRWARRGLLGKPDGSLVRLRCWLFGHDWRTCWDSCCDGTINWCEKCSARVVVIP